MTGIGQQDSGARRSRAQRQAYTRRRAERTKASAVRNGARWTIDDARAALDTAVPVPELALRLGRTASAVEGLRAKWRNGTLPSALADQLPVYRGGSRGENESGGQR